MTSLGMARQKKLPLFNSFLLFGSINTNISLGAGLRAPRAPSPGTVLEKWWVKSLMAGGVFPITST
jgi:hypothetical protein